MLGKSGGKWPIRRWLGLVVSFCRSIFWCVFFAWNYYTCQLSSRREDLRLSCLLTQALMPLESIVNLNDAIIIWLHYITFSHTCGLRTVYFINLKNFICVDIVKMSSQVLSFTRFVTYIISNKFNQHWQAAWNQSAGRMHAACGPRVGQHYFPFTTENKTL